VTGDKFASEVQHRTEMVKELTALFENLNAEFKSPKRVINLVSKMEPYISNPLAQEVLNEFCAENNFEI
jgi:hypothetical protein